MFSPSNRSQPTLSTPLPIRKTWVPLQPFFRKFYRNFFLGDRSFSENLQVDRQLDPLFFSSSSPACTTMSA